MHRHCRAILRAAELPHPTPHDTRHTFAVNLLYWTNDIDYVAQMLGDTLTVVVATYLRAPGRTRQVRAVRGDRGPEAGGEEFTGTAARLTQPVATWTQPWPR